jgi:hypothetical protein
MARDQIPICVPPWRHGNSPFFFDCQRPLTIHWPSLLSRLIFFTHPSLLEVWPSAITFGIKNLPFWTPHSLINQSLKVHIECKLDYNFDLSSLCVVLLSPPCLMYDSTTMCCISRRNEFFPDREKAAILAKTINNRQMAKK